ncbi:MAG TPA: fatty acid desaturase CarF family protein, partial [Pirellulales bacterium]|nr:fatty acid desaturase CarF family protein [Pirellulales bacterium]
PRSCPWFMRKLQQAHLIISPAAHAKHHDGTFNTSYCVLSGWANSLVDRIAPFVPPRKTLGHHD